MLADYPVQQVFLSMIVKIAKTCISILAQILPSTNFELQLAQQAMLQQVHMYVIRL